MVIFCQDFKFFWRGNSTSLSKLNYLLQVCGMYYMLLGIYKTLPNSLHLDYQLDWKQE